jgi:hypothetical protein
VVFKKIIFTSLRISVVEILGELILKILYAWLPLRHEGLRKCTSLSKDWLPTLTLQLLKFGRLYHSDTWNPRLWCVFIMHCINMNLTEVAIVLWNIKPISLGTMFVLRYLFIVHLKVLSVAESVWRQTVGWLVKNELWSTWKEAAVVYFEYCTWISCRNSWKPQKKKQKGKQIIRIMSWTWDLRIRTINCNHRIATFYTVVLSTPPARSIIIEN